MPLVSRLQTVIRRERTRVGFLAATAIITTAGAPQMRDSYPHHVSAVDAALDVTLASMDTVDAAAASGLGPAALPATAALGAAEGASGLDPNVLRSALDAVAGYQMTLDGTATAHGMTLGQPTRLETPAPAARPNIVREFATYSVNPEVSLAPNVEAKVREIAARYHAKTGKRLTVTSGTRSAVSQAEAMHTKLKLGDNVLGLYANKGAVQQIVSAAKQAKGEAAVNAMAAVIAKQQDEGVFISRHLRKGAVDFRSRDMSASDKKAFRQAVSDVGGVDTVLEESKPPHFHLEIE